MERLYRRIPRFNESGADVVLCGHDRGIDVAHSTLLDQFEPGRKGYESPGGVLP